MIQIYDVSELFDPCKIFRAELFGIKSIDIPALSMSHNEVKSYLIKQLSFEYIENIINTRIHQIDQAKFKYPNSITETKLLTISQLKSDLCNLKEKKHLLSLREWFDKINRTLEHFEPIKPKEESKFYKKFIVNYVKFRELYSDFKNLEKLTI